MDEDLQPSPSNENHIPQPSSAESTDDIIPTGHVLTQVENLSQVTNGENPVEKTRKTKRAGVNKQTPKRKAPINTSLRQRKPPNENEEQPKSKRQRIQKAIHDV